MTLTDHMRKKNSKRKKRAGERGLVVEKAEKKNAG
jgi:hypothetical protein